MVHCNSLGAVVPSFKIGCSRGEILGTLAGAAGASSCYELNLVCPVHSCQDFHTHCALTLRLLRKPAVDLIGGLPSCAHMFTRPARCVSAIPLLQPSITHHHTLQATLTNSEDTKLQKVGCKTTTAAESEARRPYKLINPQKHNTNHLRTWPNTVPTPQT